MISPSRPGGGGNAPLCQVQHKKNTKEEEAELTFASGLFEVAMPLN